MTSDSNPSLNVLAISEWADLAFDAFEQHAKECLECRSHWSWVESTATGRTLRTVTGNLCEIGDGMASWAETLSAIAVSPRIRG